MADDSLSPQEQSVAKHNLSNLLNLVGKKLGGESGSAGYKIVAREVNKAIKRIPDLPKTYKDISESSMNCYMGRNLKGKRTVHLPREKKDIDNLVGGINILLFGEDKEKYIRDIYNDKTGFGLFPKYDAAVQCEIENKPRNIGGILTAFDYKHANPNDIDTATYSAQKYQVALSSHYLYHNPSSAKLWNKIKTAPNYSFHYAQCLEGLLKLLSKDKYLIRKLSEAELIINLGAGSHTKDEVILSATNDYINKTSKPRMSYPIYAWVDASSAMLHDTFVQLDKNIAPDLQKIALVTDFEIPSHIEALYESCFSFLDVRNYWESRKVFFILGFTLSNLDEKQFLSRYKEHMNVGDVLVFSIQYIPEDCRNNTNELDRFKARLKNNYNFPEGRRLAKSGFRISLGYELSSNSPSAPDIFGYVFDGDSESQKLIFKLKVNEVADDEQKTNEIDIISAETHRHYRATYESYLESLGFKIMDSQEVMDDVFVQVVEYIGRKS